ncbi:hypothetical protein AVEN_142149-1 [Araneus ventricosus]|uniref:Uncharacterized protein n=1 Tax=Araneus ventricosus TaxID=182803 RepID=A0A4Y2DHJ1_ARAVE|nr:hypothetical protein AVEN_142149-1 [Araneus ventricosus]
MEQSGASIENFQISSAISANKNLKQSQNIVNNLTSSGHISVNSHIPGASTSDTPVSPKFVRPYPKSLPRITKGFRKRAKSTILTSTPEKQSLEELSNRTRKKATKITIQIFFEKTKG